MRRVVSRAALGWLCASALGACAVSPAFEGADLLDGSITTDMAPTVIGYMDASRPSITDRPVAENPRRDAGAGDSSALDDDGGTTHPVTDAGLMSADAGVPSDVPVLPDSGSVVPPPDPVDSGPPVVPTCAAGTTLCGSTCVDLTHDAAHCGSCATSCAGATCVASACTNPVPAGCTSKTYGAHSYLFCTTPRNWIDARDACRASKLDMTVINDAAENDFVRGAGGAWIGASDIDGEAKWRALAPGVMSRADGPLVSFTNWAVGQPSNTFYCAGLPAIGNDCLFVDKGDEDCAYMGADGRWDDARCELVRPSVCESY
jgi:hypothetical protein